MVINLPILKDHSMAGVTFAMKNMYGVVERPQDLHAGLPGSPEYSAVVNCGVPSLIFSLPYSTPYHEHRLARLPRELINRSRAIRMAAAR